MEVEKSKNPSVLLVKMLESSRQDSGTDAREARIKNINRYLKSTENYRTLGLISLAEFLELHTVVSSVFTTEKECQELEWIETVLKMIDNKSEELPKCFEILSKLIIVTSKHPDMHKVVQSKHVGKLVEAIVNSPLSVDSLKCLIVCLKEYSGPCGVFKNKIFDFCISSVDINDAALNSLSGNCLHLLQQTRGGNVGGSAHKKNWAEYHEKLLNTLEELFANLLQTGETNNTGKSERLKLPDIAEAKKNMPLMYAHEERFTRFQNVCIFLNTSLIEPFPTGKCILMSRLVSFLDKSIMTNQTQINKKDADRILPFVLNIEIQKCLLSILKALFKAVGRNIMIHSKDICDILWRCLKSTNVPYDEFKIKEVSSLRCSVYSTLVEFIKVTPNNHFVFKNMENYMKEAFLDITPIQQEILLTLPSNEAKKKKQKRDPEVKRTLAGKTFDNCIKLHQELCKKSLELLNNLLIFNGSGFKPVLFKILTDKILIVSYKFLSKDSTQEEIYHSSDCRLMILEVINNILINPAVRNATPSSFMIELLRKFKDNDKNDKVRHKASEMIRTVEAILHNRKDPIHFPPDLKDFRDHWLFNEKIVKSFAEIDGGRKISNPISQVSKEQDIQIELEPENEPEVIEIEKNGSFNGNHHKESSESEETEEEEIIMEPAVTTKRTSVSRNEEVSSKIAKISEAEPVKIEKCSKVNENEEEILDSYMADFCDD